MQGGAGCLSAEKPHDAILFDCLPHTQSVDATLIYSFILSFNILKRLRSSPSRSRFVFVPETRVRVHDSNTCVTVQSK